LNPGSRIWPPINFSQRDETVPGWFSNFSLWSPDYSFFGPEISSKPLLMVSLCLSHPLPAWFLTVTDGLTHRFTSCPSTGSQ